MKGHKHILSRAEDKTILNPRRKLRKKNFMIDGERRTSIARLSPRLELSQNDLKSLSILSKYNILELTCDYHMASYMFITYTFTIYYYA